MRFALSLLGFGIWDLPGVVECFDRASPFLSVIIF